MPRVSIVMPCFNAASFVGAAVASVLGQTFGDLELVVVDDGSTDGSLDVLRAIHDPRLKVFAQANAGQCAACNRGYRATNGDLIKFFDADDLLAPDMIARQVARLNGRMDAIALGEWRRFHGDTPGDEPFPRLSMYRDADPADWLVHEWSSVRPMMQCALWLIPRPIIEARGLWDERLSLINDFEYFARILLGACELLYAPNARLLYRSGLPASLSGRKSQSAIESQLLSLELGTRHLLAVRNDAEARAVCAGLLQDFEYSHYPNHPHLRARARARVAELGGSAVQPDGPPGFQRLRLLLGWKLARRVQRYAEARGLNAAGRREANSSASHKEPR